MKIKVNWLKNEYRCLKIFKIPIYTYNFIINLDQMSTNQKEENTFSSDNKFEFKPSLNVQATLFVPSTAPQIEFSPVKKENPGKLGDKLNEKPLPT
mgnify:CR=1 FL=1